MNLITKLKYRNSFTIGLLAIILLTSIIQPVQAPYTAEGEKISSISSIQINPPSNITYTTNKVRFDFTVESTIDARTIKSTFTYSLNGNNNITIPSKRENIAPPREANGNKIIDLITGTINLKNLQPGEYRLTIFATYLIEQEQTISFDNKTVYFTIDTNATNYSEEKSIQETLTNPIHLLTITITIITIISIFCLWQKLKKHNTTHTTKTPPDKHHSPTNYTKFKHTKNN